MICQYLYIRKQCKLTYFSKTSIVFSYAYPLQTICTDYLVGTGDGTLIAFFQARA